MNTIYWITRLNGIRDFSIVMLIVFAILTLVIAIIMFTFLVDNGIEITYDKDNRNFEPFLFLKKVFISGLIPTLFFSLCIIFIPTTKEAIAIYGGGKILDYIESNEKCKEMPDKIIDLTDKYIETLNKELDKVE